MADQMTEIPTDSAFHDESTPTDLPRTSALSDSSAIDTLEHAVYSQERKSKKGRRKSGSKKHRAGRNRKPKRYVPYFKMNARERLRLDERIERRSKRKRDFLRKCGVPLAPHNTTQFLVRDRIKVKNNGANSGDSSLSEYEGNNSEIDDFDLMWNKPVLDNSSKKELVEMYMELEDKLEAKKMKIMEDNRKIMIHREEVKSFLMENELLSLKIAEQKKRLRECSCE